MTCTIATEDITPVPRPTSTDRSCNKSSHNANNSTTVQTNLTKRTDQPKFIFVFGHKWISRFLFRAKTHSLSAENGKSRFSCKFAKVSFIKSRQPNQTALGPLQANCAEDAVWSSVISVESELPGVAWAEIPPYNPHPNPNVWIVVLVYCCPVSLSHVQDTGGISSSPCSFTRHRRAALRAWRVRVVGTNWLAPSG